MTNLNKIPKFSYSRLDTFDSCRHKYKIKYIDGKYSFTSSLALEIGSIAHKVKELKGLWTIVHEKNIRDKHNKLKINICFLKEKKNHKPQKLKKFKGKVIVKPLIIDYELLENIFYNGCEDLDMKGKPIRLTGVNELKTKYLTDYYAKCNKTGMTYDEKCELFLKELREKDMVDEEWKVVAVEQEFSVEYNGRCVLFGFIDRVDMNKDGDIRVVDYKTSKSVFDDSKIKTPLQMFVYALACKEIYGRYPIECLYDFVFIGAEQLGGTKGWLKRGEKKLTKILDAIDECAKTGVYKPSATPLCYWCSYASHTPLGDPKFKLECDYHLKWTPTSKTFAKKNEWVEGVQIFKANVESGSENYNPFKSENKQNNPFISNNNQSNPFGLGDTQKK